MSKQFGIYVGEELNEAIGCVGEYSGINISRRINEIGDRYIEIIKRTEIEKKFTEAELNLICDANNGHVEFGASMIGEIWQGIDDSMILDETHIKWNVDRESFLEKLKGLTFAEEIAVIEYYEQFWRKVSNSNRSAQ